MCLKLWLFFLLLDFQMNLLLKARDADRGRTTEDIYDMRICANNLATKLLFLETVKTDL